MKLYKILLASAMVVTTFEVNAAVVSDRNSNRVVGTKLSSGAQGSAWTEAEAVVPNLNMVQDAWDDFKGDESVKTFHWSRGKTFKTRLRLNMNTLIVIPEKLKHFTLGNSKSFQAQQLSDTLFNVRGIHAGIDTDLKLVGESGNIYNFYLRTDPIDSKIAPHLTVYIEELLSKRPIHFQHQPNLNKLVGQAKVKSTESIEDFEATKEIKAISMLPKKQQDYLNSLPDPEGVNVQYKMYGDMEISPYATYDDGNFTYFDFRGGLASDRLPVVYKVVDGFETIVNSRMENGFLIAESLSPEGWSLRNGEMVVCIRSKVDLRKLYQERNKRLSQKNTEK
jgi:ComB9 competence protein